MSLLNFMKYIAEHPDQSNLYRRDPEAFFQQLPDAERDRIALSEAERQTLQPFITPPPLETTTVMAVSRGLILGQADSASHGGESGGKEGEICLSGLSVILHAIADNDVFFAEPRDKLATAVTLPHSYIHRDDKGVYFNLHLCYTDPNNELDRPQVLYISTERQGDNREPNYIYKEVSISVAKPPYGPGYILVLSRYETHHVLGKRSAYNPDGGELLLIFGLSELPR